MDKTKLNQESLQQHSQEVRVLTRLSEHEHPNIVKLYQVINTKTKLYLVMGKLLTSLGFDQEKSFHKKLSGTIISAWVRDTFQSYLRINDISRHFIRCDIKIEDTSLGSWLPNHLFMRAYMSSLYLSCIFSWHVMCRVAQNTVAETSVISTTTFKRLMEALVWRNKKPNTSFVR